MTIFNKIKWVAGVLLVFVIVLTTNLIDKDNYGKLRDSVTSIYEDRIVASDIIFEMSLLIQEKKTAYAISDSLFLRRNNRKVNQQIEELLAKYELTKLTISEQKLFNKLKSEYSDLKKLETSYLEKGDNFNIDKIVRSIDEISVNLYDLSKVQLNEGKRQMMLSNKTMENIDLFTQLEIIFLIIMAVLVQIIILYKPKED